MSIKSGLLVFVTLLVSFTLTACGSGSDSVLPVSSQAIDYSQTAKWLALPSSPIKNVDVFFVYPTTYKKAAPTDPNFCTIDNASMVQGAKGSIQMIGTVFAPSANIYAPYYRQVDAYYQLSLPPDQQEANVAKVQGPDVIAAFEYYLQHHNNGRPIILVGHSQGSSVLKYLLATYMKAHPDVHKRMVAAYLVGVSITPTYLSQNPHLKFATGSNDTGVLVSWNTESSDFVGKTPFTEPNGIAINPITWTTDEITATKEQNLGSIQIDKTTGAPVLDAYGEILRVTNLADATISKSRGVVICSTVVPSDYSVAPYLGVYHGSDYPFYFFNVRKNAADRINQYFSANTGN